MNQNQDRPRPDATELFEGHRAWLQALAYRLVGTVSDAEDIVQDTFLRWIDVDHSKVTQPRAYLSRITTRLCLDFLKSARVRRETYIGEWLPEPLVQSAGISTTPGDGFAQDISFALMLALERLSPLERAAFLLHDVFGMEFSEIAELLQRSPASCRQLATRARSNVRRDRPRYEVLPDDGERIAEVFMKAAISGDVASLQKVLAADAVLHSDGGGKVRAVLRPIVGADRVARLFTSLARRGVWPGAFRPALINGLPGFILRDEQGITDTIALEISDQLIRAVYVVRNPDKLRHIREREAFGQN